VATPDQPVPMYAAPVSSTVIVLATSKELAGAAFEAVNGTRKPEIKKDMADLLAAADSKSSLYVAAATKGRLDSIPLPDPKIKKVIDQIHSITIDLKVEQDINLELAIGASNADEAKALKDLVVQGLDLAKIQFKVAAAQQPELQPLINAVGSMTTTQKEKTVVINGKLTGEALEKLIKK
jgi:hypothetical protein